MRLLSLGKTYQRSLPLLATAALFAGLLVTTHVNATVMQIALADFNNATVIDFESMALGSISGSDPIFSNAGISNIIPDNPGTFNDTYGVRPNSDRALGALASGLVVTDPGEAGTASIDDWTIEFSNMISRFGFALSDSVAGTHSITFFDGLATVGNFAVTTSDKENFYFESTLSFNSVRIIDNDPGTMGFVLDDLTLESIAVPEPTPLALMGLGLAGLSFRRKKQA